MLIGLAALGGATGGWLWTRTGGPAAKVPEISVEGLDRAARDLIVGKLQVVHADPHSGRAWGQLGAVLRMYDYRPEALVCLEEAQRREPAEPRWPYLQVHLLAKSSPDLALAQLRRTVELCGQEPEMPALRLAQMLAETGRQGEAAEVLEGLRQAKPGSGPVRIALARIRQTQGQWDQAAVLAAGCTTNPYTSRAAWTLLGTVRQRLGDTNGAWRASRQAASLGPDLAWPDPFEEEFVAWRADARSLSSQAQNFLAAGQLDLAAPLIERLAREHPQFVETWLLQGRLKVLQKRPAEAEEPLRRFLREEPNSVNGRFQLGMSLLAQQRFEEAAAAFEQAIELKKDFGQAYFNLGFALVKSGRRQEAVGPFRESIRQNPEMIDSYILLADLCLQLGQKEEAKELAGQARLVNPSDPRLAVLRKKMEGL